MDRGPHSFSPLATSNSDSDAPNTLGKTEPPRFSCRFLHIKPPMIQYPQHQTSINGIATMGRITSQTTPITPVVQAHAGTKATAQEIFAMESPRNGPMQG